MAKVFLYGSLGREFGEEWDFSIKSPKEALRAIEANTGVFYKYLFQREREGVEYNIIVDEHGVGHHDELSIELTEDSEIHIAPAMEGMGENNVFQKLWKNDSFQYGMYGIAAGWLLGQAAGWMDNMGWGGDSWYNPVMIAEGLSAISYEVGTALVIQGIIEAVIGEPDGPDEEDNTSTLKSTSSFIYQRPANHMVQGSVVPVGYGRLRVGSSVISSSILNIRNVKFDDEMEERINSGEDSINYTKLT